MEETIIKMSVGMRRLTLEEKPMVSATVMFNLQEEVVLE